MKYPHRFGTPLIVVGLLGLLSCTPPAEQADGSRWKAGVHYEVLPGQPPRQAGDTVRVVEFFWYGCGHCYLLEPYLVLWDRQKPPNVEFIQVPTQGRPVSRAHARLFYTLKALGRLDLHPVVFDAIHRQGNPLETLDQQCELVGRHGIPAREFLAASQSPAVEQALAAADKAMRSYRLDGVPAIVIGGRYMTDLIRTGGNAELFDLVTALTADK